MTSAARIVEATLSIADFADAWPHCRHVADFLARFAASDRYDPEQLTTRLSTFLHEALELVLRSRGPRPAADATEPASTHLADQHAGDLVVAIHRRGDRLELALAVPAGGAAGEALRRSVRRAAAPDAAAAYRAGFAAAIDGDEDGVGLLELVAHHGLELGVDDTAERLALTLRVPHE
ncbi:MAG: hypothetical protein JNL82_02110 [Myxococcales bacterium]|nr:hypothetical protein [Myxococcales bacterium]